MLPTEVLCFAILVIYGSLEPSLIVARIIVTYALQTVLFLREYNTKARCNVLNSSGSGQELSLLVTNLLVHDTRDPNPAVAASAVTSLAALTTASDVALTALLATLDCQHAKVRLSCVKDVYSFSHIIMMC